MNKQAPLSEIGGAYRLRPGRISNGPNAIEASAGTDGTKLFVRQLFGVSSCTWAQLTALKQIPGKAGLTV